jgi:hypothetical protein
MIPIPSRMKEGCKSWEICKSSPMAPNSAVYMRVAGVDDLESMTKLEREVWDEEHAASPKVIERRLSANPASTIIAFADGAPKAIGFFTLLGTSHETVSVLRKWDFYARLANEPWKSEEVYYGISLTVSREAPRGTGTCIMQAAADYCKWRGAQKLIAVTRAPSYHLFKTSIEFDEYYNGLLQGRIKEPLYFLMCSAGWQLVGYCADYYDDPQSSDYGLHFEVSM